jgi:hypothetical protein
MRFTCDFKLTESTRAVFSCERGTVQFYFVVATKTLGRDSFIRLKKPLPSGNKSSKLALGQNFRSVEFALQSLGASASACGITASMAVERPGSLGWILLFKQHFSPL